MNSKNVRRIHWKTAAILIGKPGITQRELSNCLGAGRSGKVLYLDPTTRECDFIGVNCVKESWPLECYISFNWNQ